jgi:hypothetical protein
MLVFAKSAMRWNLIDACNRQEHWGAVPRPGNAVGPRFTCALLGRVRTIGMSRDMAPSHTKGPYLTAIGQLGPVPRPKPVCLHLIDPYLCTPYQVRNTDVNVLRIPRFKRLTCIHSYRPLLGRVRTSGRQVAPEFRRARLEVKLEAEQGADSWRMRLHAASKQTGLLHPAPESASFHLMCMSINFHEHRGIPV